MEVAVFCLAVLFALISILAFHRYIREQTLSSLQKWCESHDYELVSARKSLFLIPPYVAVYRIEVRDRAGTIARGKAMVGSFISGGYDEISVELD